MPNQPQSKTAEQDTPVIFISYSRKNAVVADEIESAFRGMPLRLLRDIRDVALGRSFKEFMLGVRESDFVIILLSEEFLKSRSCMYEVLELLNARSFREKVLPVIVGDKVSMLDDDARMIFYEHWKNELRLAEERSAKMMNTDYFERLRHTREINNKLDVFFNLLLDMSSIGFDRLKAENYKPLFDRLRLSEDLPSKEAMKAWLISDREEREIALHRLQAAEGENKYTALMIANAVSIRGEEKNRAKFLYEELVRKYPSFYFGIITFAIYLHDYCNEYTRAKELYERCFGIDDRNPVAHANYARLLHYEYNDMPAARKHYEQAIETGNADFLCLFNYARLLDKELGEYDEAVVYYKKVLERLPEYALPYYYIAKIYYEKKPDPGQAGDYYRKAIEFAPGWFEALNDYGHFLTFGLSDIKNGEEYFLKALDADPSSALVHKNLGSLYLLSEKLGLAARYFEKANELQPDEKVYFNLAVLYTNELNNNKRAGECFEAALEINPAYAKAHFYYSRLLLVSSGVSEKAKKHYLEATQLAPQFIDPQIDQLLGINR